MFNLKIAASLIATAVLINFIINFSPSSPKKEAEEDPAPTPQHRSLKIKKDPVRKVASFSLPKFFSKTPEPSNAEIKRTDFNQSNFNTSPSGVAPSAIGGRGSLSRNSSKAKSLPITRNYLNEVPSRSAGATVTPTEKEIVAVSGGRTLVSKTETTNTKTTTTIASATKTAVSSSSSTPSTVTPAPTTNTCSANINGGSFNSAINVNLSCSNVSQIKYCLGLNTGGGCCNPESAGVAYTGQVTVGPTGGDYCLSYYGTSASNGKSVVYQQSYTINSALPDLQVGQPKLFYQTTQLNGKSFINSQDFGKSGYSIGQVNLKTHDPSSLSMTCEEIVANYVTLPAPAPISVLALLDVSSDSPATQIEIPLRLDQLDYGDNFITSYIENANFAAPLYSCSTSKINLSDFEFYDDGVASGDQGTNTVREFSGGFSSYGFFEDESVVFREPAGVAENNQSGQTLEQGMFGMFY